LDNYFLQVGIYGRLFRHLLLLSRDVASEWTTLKTPLPTVLPLSRSGRCLATTIVSLYVSLSLLSNGYICHNFIVSMLDNNFVVQIFQLKWSDLDTKFIVSGRCGSVLTYLLTYLLTELSPS
jgi:hypothetical protein